MNDNNNNEKNGDFEELNFSSDVNNTTNETQQAENSDPVNTTPQVEAGTSQNIPELALPEAPSYNYNPHLNYNNTLPQTQTPPPQNQTTNPYYTNPNQTYSGAQPQTPQSFNQYNTPPQQYQHPQEQQNYPQQGQQNNAPPIYINNYGGQGPNNMYPSTRSKTVSIILCLLGFLGFGGIHRFYTGSIGLGILYFFTFGLCGIGTIVDLVMILTNSYRDADGYIVSLS